MAVETTKGELKMAIGGKSVFENLEITLSFSFINDLGSIRRPARGTVVFSSKSDPPGFFSFGVMDVNLWLLKPHTVGYKNYGRSVFGPGR